MPWSKARGRPRSPQPRGTSPAHAPVPSALRGKVGLRQHPRDGRAVYPDVSWLRRARWTTLFGSPQPGPRSIPKTGGWLAADAVPLSGLSAEGMEEVDELVEVGYGEDLQTMLVIYDRICCKGSKEQRAIQTWKDRQVYLEERNRSRSCCSNESSRQRVGPQRSILNASE